MSLFCGLYLEVFELFNYSSLKLGLIPLMLALYRPSLFISTYLKTNVVMVGHMFHEKKPEELVSDLTWTR